MTIRQLIKKCDAMEKRMDKISNGLAVLHYEVKGLIETDNKFKITWPILKKEMDEVIKVGNQIFGIDTVNFQDVEANEAYYKAKWQAENNYSDYESVPY